MAAPRENQENHMFRDNPYGALMNPFGQPWGLATHKEDLTTEEIAKRMESAFAPAKAAAKA